MDDDLRFKPTRRQVLLAGAAGLGVITLGPFLEACAGSSTTTRTGGTLKLAIGDADSKDTLDPAKSVAAMTIMGAGLIYDRLLTMDINWKLLPALAEDHSASSDSMTWTFKLRKGVQFSNGKTFSSADVVAHFSRLLVKANSPAGYGIFHPILDTSGITAPDANTVKFSLKIPDAFFGVKVAHYTAHIPQAGIADFVAGPIGTGPFKVKSFEPGTGLQVVRNPNYWQSGKPVLDGVNIVNVPDQATKAQSVLSGDVDIATDVSTSAYSQFQNSSTVALLDLQSYSPYTFDIDSSIKPYSDPKVSKAMKMLLDRNKMLSIVVGGHGVVSADSLIPPSDPYYPSDLKPFTYDPEQAKSLLASAGYSNGFKDDIWTTKAYPYLDEGAAFGQQAWQAGKINMTIQSVSNDQYLGAFLVKPVLMDYYLRLHPVTMFEQYYASGPNNTTRIKDDQIDGWIKELKSTLDDAKQKQLAGEILHRYNDIAAEIVPFHFSTLWPYKKRVKNITLDPMTNLDFRVISLG